MSSARQTGEDKDKGRGRRDAEEEEGKLLMGGKLRRRLCDDERTRGETERLVDGLEKNLAATVSFQVPSCPPLPRHSLSA
eukprot:760064-Hanusia_phi.AAC.3